MELLCFIILVTAYAVMHFGGGMDYFYDAHRRRK